MNKWQSHTALNRVKEEVVSITGAAADALETVISTPVDETREYGPLAGPVETLGCVPGIMASLERTELAWLAAELELVLSDTLARLPQLDVNNLDERLQEAFRILTILPALLDDALLQEPQGYEQVMPLINRLRRSRRAARVFNSRVLVERPHTNFRRQEERHAGRLVDALEKQAAYCGKACRRLSEEPDNVLARQVLEKAVGNLELLLRDFGIGTAWALANILLREPAAGTTPKSLDVFAALTGSLLKRCQGGLSALDAPCEDDILDALQVLLREQQGNDAPGYLFDLCLGVDPETLAAWEADLQEKQIRYFGHDATLKSLRLLLDDITMLVDRINNVVEQPPITRGKLSEIQNDSLRLVQALTFMGYTAVELPPVFSAAKSDNDDDPQSLLLALARALFAVSREIEDRLGNLKLAAFCDSADDHAGQPDSARLHAYQAAMQALDVIIDALDRVREQAGATLPDAEAGLELLAGVFTMLSMPEQAQQMALAGEYVASLARDGEELRLDAGFQSLCHLLVNTSCFLEQLCLGREQDSVFYRDKNADFADRVGTGLEDREAARRAVDDMPAEAPGNTVLPEACEPDQRPEVVALLPAPAPAPAADTGGDDDDDIRAIFLEEFDEIMASLDRDLVALSADPGRPQLVRDCGRYFHTLKGSGRMAGVDLLVDLGLAMEKLFDAQQRLPAISEPVLVFARRVHDVLAGLKSTIADPDAPAGDPSTIDALCTQAAAFLAGDEADGDPLVNGFLQEARHLVAELAQAQRDWLHAPDPGARRAGQERTDGLLNLLQGAAESAGLVAVNELLEAMVGLYGAVDCRQAIPAGVSRLMLDCDDYLQDMLASLDRGHGPAHTEVLLQAITREIPALASRDEPAPESTAGTDGRDLAPAMAAGQTTAAVDAAPAEEPVDQSLLQVFVEEAEELLQAIDDLSQRWQENPADEEALSGSLRILHTLKGSAALVQDFALSEAAHDFETYILKRRNQPAGFDSEFFSQCDNRLLVLHGLCQLYVRQADGRIVRADLPVMEEAVAEDQLTAAPEDGAEPDTTAEGERQPEPAPVDEEKAVEAAPAAADEADTAPAGTSAAGQAPEKTDMREESRQLAEEQVRVSSQLLRFLLNEADEINFSRNRMEKSFDEVGNLLLDMDEKLTRLKTYVKRFEDTAGKQGKLAQAGEGRISDEFDALEMDRYTEMQEMALSMTEDYEDLKDIRLNLAGRLKDIDHVLSGQRRLTNSLQDGLISSQMLPFVSIVPRLRRLVRQVGKELGKQVRLEIENQQGNLDKHVLQAIITPFEHLLRNALDHGIETPEERERAGKPAQAVIAIKVSRQGAGIVIELRDDGRGIDVEKVKNKARERGLLAADADIADDAACQLVFQSGFSTSDRVSTISGRGVGLDVVKKEINQIGGSVEVQSEAGHGTAFVLHLPLTSSLNRALLFEIQGQTYVVLMNTLEGVLVEKLASVYSKQQDGGKPVFEYGNNAYEYLYLGKLINESLEPKPDVIETSIPLLLVSGRHKHYALHIDSIIESRDLVVKSIGRQFSTMPGIGGGVILPDGNVAIVLDLPSLVDLHDEHRTPGVEQVFAANPQAAKSAGGRTIMVVDDSITVRKVTAKILERNGLKVVTAKDGLEAVELLEQHIPDVILLDIEMPRMDGFEVATWIRAQQPPVRDIPIIMITSRIGEKHRSRAEQIGVNEYLCKPFQEESLLAHIDRMKKS